MKKKSIALLASLVLVVGIAAGGTLAWLIDNTKPVVNTFTTSDVEIALDETASDFQMVPGKTIKKDPKVTVKAGSEECYVFVKIDKSDNYDTYMDGYTLADGWKTDPSLSGNVVYRVVDKSDSNQEFPILEGNQVTVKDTVTREDMAKAQSSQPTLTFTAYAVQFDYLSPATVANAWTLASDN